METLAEVCERSGFRVHSYVLMGNHYHLLLETPDPNLVAGMKWFQGTYTQRFNARHRQTGHLFQGRYKAVPVEVENPEYFGRVSRYIHLNPARAGLLNGAHPRLGDYRWSSFPAFVRSASLKSWLVRGRVFGSVELPDESETSRKLYGRDMEFRSREVCRGVSVQEEAAWRDLRRGWYVGGSDFGERLRDMASGAAEGRKRESYERVLMEKHDRRTAAGLLEVGLRAIGMTKSEARLLRQNDPRKQGLAWLVKSRTVMGDEWIQRELEMGHRSNVSRAVSAFRSATDATRRRIKRVMHKCTD